VQPDAASFRSAGRRNSAFPEARYSRAGFLNEEAKQARGARLDDDDSLLSAKKLIVFVFDFAVAFARSFERRRSKKASHKRLFSSAGPPGW